MGKRTRSFNAVWSRANESSLTLHDLITKNKNEITPKKRGYEVEDRRLRRLLKEKEIMKVLLKRLFPPILASFRDKRLKDGVRACQYNLVLIRLAYNIALIEWGWNIGDNPTQKIRLLE